ncbi:hypothetical protein BDV59DRAFT_207173 [Aspergillus ambiguus]|uniref:uncharacterized protein n=1 Tax=Aspergillus ambiguus TaxID=176160 RepID=UPI003CCDE186
MDIKKEEPKKSPSWARFAIFTSLHVLLLESVIEWTLVMYLYGNHYVDTKMGPSLIMVFIASSFTVPLVALHSLLAWQYNRVSGFKRQKRILSVTSTYLLRITITVWLSASVAGLIVVTQQVSCLPVDAGNEFWNAGVSCALHRAAIVVSVLAFATVCLYFCSRELCDRPYEMSLLGVYKKKGAVRDDSIVSHSSSATKYSYKDDMAYFCRTPDTYGSRGFYLSSSDNSIEKPRGPNLQHPAPIRPTPQLNIGGDHESEHAEIISGSSVSPTGTLRDGSTSNGVSRTTTGATSRTGIEHRVQPPVPELPAGLVPPGSGHKRQKSSVSISSLRRYLPKLFGFSLPLSQDPQIRALSEPNAARDVEKQSLNEAQERSEGLPLAAVSEEKQLAPPPIDGPDHPPMTGRSATESRPAAPRTMTMVSANAPEVVEPPAQVHRPNNIARQPPPGPPPVYRPVPPNPLAWHPVNPTAPVRVSELGSPARQTPRHTAQRQSQAYNFEPARVPRHTRSQYHPPSRYGSYSRSLRRLSSFSARNDIEILYPSTRRPRSTTCGGISALDSIRESGASVDETPGSDAADENTYRGTTRTSVHGY